MGSSAESFRLRWNDFGTNIMGSMQQLRQDDDFLDVSLVTSDSGTKVIEAHRVVLAACSNFFKQILRRQSRSYHPNPFIFLRGISYDDLAAVVEFMYHGEVKVGSEKLGSFLAVAEELQIKGLTNRKNAQVVSKNLNDVVKVARPSSGGGGGSSAKKIRRSLPAGTSLSHSERSNSSAPTVVDPEPSSSVAVIMEEVVIKADPDEHGSQDEDHHQLQQDGDSGDENYYGEPRKSKFDPMDYVRILTDDESAKAECTICNAKFKGVINAKVHAIRTHGPPEYYQCNFCGKVVRCSYNFRDHIMRAHGINGRKLVETYGKLVGEM